MDEKNKQQTSFFNWFKNTPSEKIFDTIKTTDKIEITEQKLTIHDLLLDSIQKSVKNKYLNWIQLTFTICIIFVFIFITWYSLYFLYQKRLDLVFMLSLFGYIKDSCLLIFFGLFIDDKIRDKHKKS